MKRIFFGAITLALATALSGCNPSTTTYVDPGQPVAYSQPVTQTVVHDGYGTGTVIAAAGAGALAGHLMSRPHYGGYYHAPTPRVVNHYHYSAPRTVFRSTPSFRSRSSGFGGFRSRR